MKIAFATQDLKRVDAHFGWARNIAIYDVSPRGYQFLEAVQFDGDLQQDGNEDKLAPKIEAIKDCTILYVAAIGGSGAARVVASNIYPMKVNHAGRNHRPSRQAHGRAQGRPAALAAQGAAEGPGSHSRFRGQLNAVWFQPDVVNMRATETAAQEQHHVRYRHAQGRHQELSAKAINTKMNLHDLAEDLPINWPNIMTVAQEAFDAFKALDAARQLLEGRGDQGGLIRQCP